VTSTTSSVLIGAALAVVVVAAAVGALVMLRPTGGGVAESAAPTRVVVVFAMAGEDNAVTAQLVAVVDSASGRYELKETSSTVSIPGTSYSLLRDAYPFGGAKAVAAALDGGAVKAGTGWVDISPEAWQRLLAAGVEVTITEPFDTFDEASDRYTEFEAGTQRVEAADLRSLVNGVPYLGSESRTTILGELAAASLRALASTTPTQGIATDLTTGQWTALAATLRKD
jgi:hypothetical protein